MLRSLLAAGSGTQRRRAPPGVGAAPALVIMVLLPRDTPVDGVSPCTKPMIVADGRRRTADGGRRTRDRRDGRGGRER